MINHLGLILIAACANVALNLLLKQGARGLDTSGLVPLIGSLILSIWFWLACLSAAVLLTAFVTAIRSYSLSLTYTAVTALAMVALTLLGVAMQTEQVSLLRGVGLTLIVSGLVVTALA